MRISELITELEKHIEEHGDAEVFLREDTELKTYFYGIRTGSYKSGFSPKSFNIIKKKRDNVTRPYVGSVTPPLSKKESEKK